MLVSIQEFFERRIACTTTLGDDPRALQLATAALLVELMRADFEVGDEEHQAVVDNLRSFFGLAESETRELVALAEREADEGVSLYQFTSLIGKHFDAARKQQIIEMLWRISYADGHKHMYEEHLVRKLAKLLYVPHMVFVQARLKIEAEYAQAGS